MIMGEYQRLHLIWCPLWGSQCFGMFGESGQVKKTRHQQRPGLHDMLQLGDFAMHPLHQCILNLEETITEMVLRGMFLPMLKNEMFFFQSKGYFGKRSLYTSSSQVVLTPESHQVNRSTGSPRGKLLPHRMDGFHRSQHLMGLIHGGLCLFHFIVKVCLGEARNVTTPQNHKDTDYCGNGVSTHMFSQFTSHTFHPTRLLVVSIRCPTDLLLGVKMCKKVQWHDYILRSRKNRETFVLKSNRHEVSEISEWFFHKFCDNHTTLHSICKTFVICICNVNTRFLLWYPFCQINIFPCSCWVAYHKRKSSRSRKAKT